MASFVEREIKLQFASPGAARAAVSRLSTTPKHGRRLQDDRLLDWPDGRLRRARCVLRVRHEEDRAWLTFKGPPQASTMKVREEIETAVGEATRLLAILNRLGLETWFRYQKYREEVTSDHVIVAIDETQIGTFVELEGHEEGIRRVARAMGFSQDEFILDSYRGLFVQAQESRGLKPADMLFVPS